MNKKVRSRQRILFLLYRIPPNKGKKKEEEWIPKHCNLQPKSPPIQNIAKPLQSNKNLLGPWFSLTFPSSWDDVIWYQKPSLPWLEAAGIAGFIGLVKQHNHQPNTTSSSSSSIFSGPFWATRSLRASLPRRPGCPRFLGAAMGLRRSSLLRERFQTPRLRCLAFQWGSRSLPLKRVP